MNQPTSFLKTALKGMAMGVAEVIPGVSGGTIAFITGIYERLLNAIKAFDPELIVVFRKEGIKGIWQQIDGTFLLSLGIGMAAGIVIGVLGISHLLEEYPPIVWGFFFGLIIASAIYIIQQISHWDVRQVLGLIIGAGAAYYITTISPLNGLEALWFVFLCGAIAISALILPGISGSFILLILGMYTYIVTDTLKAALTTLDPEKILVMVVFALGCITGLASISRVLSWTFKYYRNLTLATLTGFIIGSLNKIWPWRNPTEWLRDVNGNIIMEEGVPKKILMAENVWPVNYDGEAFLTATIVSVVIGFAIVFLLERLGKD